MFVCSPNTSEIASVRLVIRSSRDTIKFHTTNKFLWRANVALIGWNLSYLVKKSAAILSDRSIVELESFRKSLIDKEDIIIAWIHFGFCDTWISYAVEATDCRSYKQSAHSHEKWYFCATHALGPRSFLKIGWKMLKLYRNYKSFYHLWINFILLCWK